jgi:predicted nucleic acid-binding Zn ribbon protein
MYDKVCVICKQPFRAINPRYKTCSPDCHHEYDKIYNRIYGKSYRTRRKFNPSHYEKVQKHCKLCGDILPDGRQTYCLRCLINGFVHGDVNTRQKSMGILNCRGFSVDMIWQKAAELNLV